MQDGYCDIVYKFIPSYIRPQFYTKKKNCLTIPDFEKEGFLCYVNEAGLNHMKRVKQSYSTVEEMRRLGKIMAPHLYNINILWKNNLKQEQKFLDGRCVIIISINTNELAKVISNRMTYNDNYMFLCFIINVITNADNNKYSNIIQYNFDKNPIGFNEEELVKSVMTPKTYPLLKEKKCKLQEIVVPKLFSYQKHTIEWMMNIENTTHVCKYTNKYNIKFLNFKIYDYDIFMNDSEKQIYFYGGGLIDEMGLGKTLQITVLSLMNSDDEYDIRKDFMYDMDKLRSRATLIICPNQLATQWKNEITKTINHEVKVYTILSKTHFKKLTYKDVMEADFVIVSYNFMNNRAYTDHLEYGMYGRPYQKRTRIDYDNMTEYIHKQGINIVDKGIENPDRYGYINEPLIHLIYWRRVVVDEFHDIYNRNVTVTTLLPHIDSRFRWCVTGTPFTGNHNMLETIKFISNNYSLDDSIYTSKSVCNTIKNLFRRNTKDSVKQELTLPPIKNIYKFLEFTQTEKIMYNSYAINAGGVKNSVYIRKLCCHPNFATETKHVLTNCKTLEDIENTMNKFYKLDYDNCKKQCDMLLTSIKDTKIELFLLGEEVQFDSKEDEKEAYKLKKFAYHFSFAERIPRTYERLRLAYENYATFSKELDNKKRSLTFYQNIMNVLKSNDKLDDCGICLDEMKYDNIAICMCSHIFCNSCITESIRAVSNKCPSCEMQLSNDKIFRLYSGKKEKKAESNDLVNKYGTKIANLIAYLRKYSNTKTILFSQWDDLLVKVGDILNECKISNIFCRGSYSQRNSAISKFNDGMKVNVIMLSLLNSASGTNLTSASQIIFLDSIDGTPEHKHDVESQAIARAVRLGQTHEYIKVVRFIIKNTIEEELHNKFVQIMSEAKKN